MGSADAGDAGPQRRQLSELGPAGALDVVGRIEASLVAGGFKVTRDSVAGRRTVIGRQGRPQVRRLGARHHTFVLVGVFKAGLATPEHLDRFLAEAGQYAATVKGGLPGGARAVAVAVAESAPGAEGWALSPPPPPRPGFAPAFPVLVDLGARRLVFRQDPAEMRRLAELHVRAVLAGEGAHPPFGLAGG